MTTICACVSKEPINVSSHLEHMIRRAGLGRRSSIHGFMDGSPFSTPTEDFSLPQEPARWGAAAIDFDVESSGMLVDAPSLRNPSVSSILSFLSNFEGRVSSTPLFGVSILPRGRDAIIARDPIGSRPLYVSSGDPSLYCTQPRLLPLTNGHPEPFCPATALTTGKGTSTRLSMPALAPHPGKIASVGTVDLIETLSEAVKAIPDPRLVFFSGGIDSLVIAKVAINMGDTILLTAGMEESKDLKRAQTAAKSLSADFITATIRKEEIPDDIRVLRKILATDDPMIIAISLPLYHAALKASEVGAERGMAGQGADELFGGYHRYLAQPDPAWSMYEDLMNLHSRGLDAFNLSAAAAGVRIFMPYLDQDFISLVQSTPIEEKIHRGKRKILLRRMGRSLGLGASDVSVKKLAIQYGSGVNREVLRALRRRSV